MAKIRIAQKATFNAPVLIPIVGSAPEKVVVTGKDGAGAELAAVGAAWTGGRVAGRGA
ncbi:phage tail assembly chaperone, partial [Pseudomonas cyclaminis]|uniref:phage tail assembly chaperone n=1 Tax=Pseudomonas cyclaminis TaxID=2781239 RepID=UPI0038007054